MYYRLSMKLWEGNVFNHVCQSVCLFTWNVHMGPLPMMTVGSYGSRGANPSSTFDTPTPM